MLPGFLPRAASGSTTRALHFFCLAEFCDCPWPCCDHLIDRCLFYPCAQERMKKFFKPRQRPASYFPRDRTGWYRSQNPFPRYSPDPDRTHNRTDRISALSVAPSARRSCQPLNSLLDELAAGCRAARGAEPRVRWWSRRGWAVLAQRRAGRCVWRPRLSRRGVVCAHVCVSPIRIASTAGQTLYP